LAGEGAGGVRQALPNDRRRSGIRRCSPSGDRCREPPLRRGGARLDTCALSETMSRIVPAAKIIVVDNQIEPALKALKKQMLKDGLFQEMKRRVAYDKPSVKRKRKQAAARKKRRQAMRRLQAARD